MNKIKTSTVEALGRLLPARIKKSLFHLSFHLARAEFEQFAHDYSFAPNMAFGLAELAERGFSPATIVDVGAFQGSWSKLARSIWPESELIMIEPDLTNGPALTALASQLNAVVYPELLGAADGQEVQFNVMGSGSSVLAERSPLPREKVVRRLRRLDTIGLNIANPTLLKIDAQGYELEILKGAARIMPKIAAILIEIAVIEINEGAPLLHEVLPFMKALGFVTYDIVEIHRRPLDKALNQVDLLFVRESSALISDKRHFAVPKTRYDTKLNNVAPTNANSNKPHGG